MKIAVVDDDTQIRKQILNLVEKFKKEKNISNLFIREFDSGEALIEKYKLECDLDILFIDIEMKNISGIDAVKVLHNINKSLIVIFITSHINYAEDMFRVGAFRLLLKPINEISFQKDFLKAIQEYDEKNKHFTIKCKGSNIAVPHKEIIYIESYDRHLVLFTENTSYEFAGKISDIETQIKSLDFVRCHKGYIVNMNYVKKININEIEIENYKPIPLSKHRRAEVLNKFSFFLKRR